jgi:hypothetical protein
VSPSLCGGAVDAGPACPAYAQPCGPGCIPAGAACCDAVGHFCTATESCASATSCWEEDASVPASEVKEAGSSAAVSSPLQDPPNAAGRSCAMAPANAASGVAASGVALAVLCALARRRRSRAR